MRLKWDDTGHKFYETGTRRGVLYVQDGTTGDYTNGVAWNGLTGFTKTPTGAEANKLYADDTLYANLRSAEELEGTLTAYTYPDEFAECDGSAVVVGGLMLGQQKRKTFGFSYRTLIGNDISDDVGYKLHLIYGATASPSEKAYTTINDSPEAIEFSWDITTTPVPVADHEGRTFKPTAEIVIDSRDWATTEKAAKLTAFEDILYGAADTYAETEDTTIQDGKTYYTRSGEEGAYTYTAFTGAEFVESTTYYEKTEHAPTLLLPDDVIAHFTAA